MKLNPYLYLNGSRIRSKDPTGLIKDLLLHNTIQIGNTSKNIIEYTQIIYTKIDWRKNKGFGNNANQIVVTSRWEGRGIRYQND